MIRIVTDSAADLTARDLETPGVTVVPMGITFADGTATVDDGSMTKDEFFTRLAEDSKLPRTSQPSPASFIELFEEAADAGDEVIVITIAQKLSGTYQCASLAAAETDAKVYIIDSETATQGEAIIVREAIRLREQGLSASRIAAELQTFKRRVRVVAIVDSLKHQQKGRGRPGALVAMYRQLDKQGGVDPAYGYTLLYSDDKQLTAPVHHYLHQNLHLTGGRVGQIGPTIGTHIGPGAVGVAFVIPE